VAALDPVAGLRGGVMQVRPVDAADWPALAAGFRDMGFEQSLPYASAAAARVGATLSLLAVEAGGAPVAVAAVRIKRVPGLGSGIAWVPSGPLILPAGGATPDAAVLGAILAALRGHLSGHVLRFRLSGLALQEAGALRAIAAAAGFAPTTRARPYRSIGIDLSRGTDALMAAFNGKWRTDLRFALKSGLELQRGSGPALEARFLAMLETVQAAKGFHTDITPAFHFPLHSPGYAVETLIAVKDGQDVAGIVTGRAGTCTTYLFGATAEAGRPVRAGYFLTWAAICHAAALGQTWYDMGGIDAETNPEVTRFKERMNGVALFAEPCEARPSGVRGRLVLGAEALRARLRGR